MQTSGLECDMQEDFAQSVADTLSGCDKNLWWLQNTRRLCKLYTQLALACR